MPPPLSTALRLQKQMKILLYAFYYLPWVGCLALTFYIDTLRREIRRRVRETAEATVTALRNSVIVDGVELPLPHDQRWAGIKMNIQLTYDGDLREKVVAPGLSLGPVCVTGHERLAGGENGVYVNSQTLNNTKKMREYAASVWAAQRSRVVREALEKGETP